MALRNATEGARDALNIGTTYTTSNGCPVSDTRNSLTVGAEGPLVIDQYFFDVHQQFNRERIPERVVHAVGAGAYGRFQVTSPFMSTICKAAVFKPGTTTDTFARFSLVAPERGAADLVRDPRGFAIKFQTTEGIWDLVCNDIPVFWVRDPVLFPALVHSQKRNPQTNMWDANAFYDFLASAPESLHTYLMVFGDRGVPATFRHMNGYGNHSFRVVNSAGRAHYVKFHVKTDVGIKTMTSDAAEVMRGLDSDHCARDLQTHLSGGGSATWTMFVQAVPEEEVATYGVDIFDVTKVIPHGDYPLHEVGRLTLDRLPTNFFAEVEQVAFSPGNLVPGIEPSPDRLFQGRMFAYADTQRHRLGPNFMQLPINKPSSCPVHNINRDGLMCFANPGGEANYVTGHPMATGGPQRTDPAAGPHGWEVPPPGRIGRFDQRGPDDARGKCDDFAQPRALVTRVMNDGERMRLVSNIVGHLKDASFPVQGRFVALLGRVDTELGQRVQTGLAGAAAGAHEPTSAKVPSAHHPSMVELQVKQSNTILGTPEHPADETARSRDATGSGQPQQPLGPGGVSATIAESRAAQQTMGGQPSALKGTVAKVAEGVSRLMQGGQQA